MIAESFERIHRSNLVGMGILPLQFTDGASTDSLGLTGTCVYVLLSTHFAMWKGCCSYTGISLSF